MRSLETKQIARNAVLIAMTTMATMLIQVPIPATKGYINLGDGVLLCAALLFGKRTGFLVGGIGSALADLLLGYTWYAPITFVVKGFEGFIAGWLFHDRHAPTWLSSAVGAFVMVGGYFIAESVMYTMPTAALSILPNGFQGLGGVIISLLTYYSLHQFMTSQKTI